MRNSRYKQETKQPFEQPPFNFRAPAHAAQGLLPLKQQLWVSSGLGPMVLNFPPATSLLEILQTPQSRHIDVLWTGTVTWQKGSKDALWGWCWKLQEKEKRKKRREKGKQHTGSLILHQCEAKHWACSMAVHRTWPAPISALCFGLLEMLECRMCCLGPRCASWSCRVPDIGVALHSAFIGFLPSGVVWNAHIIPVNHCVNLWLVHDFFISSATRQTAPGSHSKGQNLCRNSNTKELWYSGWSLLPASTTATRWDNESTASEMHQIRARGFGLG